MENKFLGDSHESAYHTMSQCFQCAGNEAKLAKYEEELKAVKLRLSKHKEQLKAVEAKLSEREGELGPVELQLWEREAELKAVELKLSERDGELKTVESKLSEHAEVRAVELKMSEREEEFKVMELKVSEREENVKALELKLLQREGELEAAKKMAQESNAKVTGLLRETLKRHKESEFSAKLHALASEVYEGLYKSKCEEAERMREGAEEGAAEIEKESCNLGHDFVEALIEQGFSKERYSKAEEALSEIIEKKKRLIEQGVLEKVEIRKSQRLLCSILRQLASIKDQPTDEEAAKDKLNRLKAIHRSIWKRREEAQGLSEDDEWVLENGHKLGLVLAELERPGEHHYRLAEHQLRQVWNARKRSPAFGPNHNDMVDSALQLVSMLEKQERLDKKQKTAEIEEILRGTWLAGNQKTTAIMLECGHKLGELLYQQRGSKYTEAVTVLTEVWKARKASLGQRSKEGNNARLTGYILASSLYDQSLKDKYETAAMILKELWDKRNYMSSAVPPAAYDIGYRLAWSYRLLEKYESAEPVFQAIWEIKKNHSGLDHPETLAVQYQLGFVQYQLGVKGSLPNRLTDAEDKFRYIWEKKRDGIEDESKKQATIASLRAGHQLGLCLSRRKCHQLAVDVLEEVYNGRIKVLGEDAKDTQTTKVALEEANGALVVQMKELKANAERAIAEAKWQKEKEEKEARDKKAQEDALKEQGKEEVRMEIAREKAMKREEHVEMTNRIKEAYWFGAKP
jgi:hypothetical protein